MTTTFVRPLALFALIASAALLGACQTPVVGPGTTKPTPLLTMKGVPGGTFLRDETSGNTTTVSAFLISETEVTRTQYVAVTGLDDPSSTTYSSGTSDPVQMVSWYQILVFSNKLSLREGLTPVYSIGGTTDPGAWGGVPTSANTTWDAVTVNWNADGYRLPTEAEWMWAAMGAQGTSTKAFAGSTGTNSVGDYAWTRDNASGKSHPVKGKLPNELGLYDLTGNVWERTWDWYGVNLPTGALTNSRGPAAGTERSIRGGAWYEVDPATLKVSARNKLAPATPDAVIGFRVVQGSGNYAVTPYAVVYDANGGGGTPPASVMVEPSGWVVLPPNPFTRTGYAFAGWEVWRAGATSAEATLAAGTSVVVGSANVTIRAAWLATPGELVPVPVKAK